MIYDINEIIKDLGWERAHKTEVVVKALIDVGINPKNCFFDDKDNLIIPVSEIQKKNKEFDLSDGIVLARQEGCDCWDEFIHVDAVKEFIDIVKNKANGDDVELNKILELVGERLR